MDWSNYQFRCSKLGQLMTEPRSKSAEFGLSETTKAYLQEVYIQEVYGREKDVMNRFMAKGLIKEEDSISLLTKVTGVFFIKNEARLENEFIKGTPDIITPKYVIDVKTSWDIWSFAKAEMTKDYEWQLRGYLWLTDLKEAVLYYCLVDAPDVLIEDELRRLNWKMYMIDDVDPFYVEAAEKVKKNMTFNDIPILKRIKSFQIDNEHEKREALKERIRRCREYLSLIDL